MKYILYLIFLLSVQVLLAQTPYDTTITQQTPRKVRAVSVKHDSARLSTPVKTGMPEPATDTALIQLRAAFKTYAGNSLYSNALKMNPYYNFFALPENLVIEERSPRSRDAFFYLLAGLLLFFAFVKLLFNRYVTNLLGLVFRGSLRQKQIREQLLQTPLPSLFLNIFFVVVAGLYIFFLLQYYSIAPHTPFWLMLLYCVLAVGLVYLVKFMILKLTGWIFNMQDAADTYIFIVFLVNKLLAIFLLPLLIVMTFSLASWGNVLLTLSYVMIVLFFGYRYIVSFAPVRREVKVSQFHFFMYLCAFEIVPLLLIYKVLVHFF